MVFPVCTLSVSISHTTSSSVTESPTAKTNNGGACISTFNSLVTQYGTLTPVTFYLWYDDLYQPFSHLTSPSVTDSANAGVLTVTTSSPARKQKQQLLRVKHCAEPTSAHNCWELLQYILWTADVLKYLMWKTFADGGNSHLNVKNKKQWRIFFGEMQQKDRQISHWRCIIVLKSFETWSAYRGAFKDTYGWEFL